MTALLQELTPPQTPLALAREQDPDPIRLWHDDARRPPDSEWVWARTNAEAMKWLRTKRVVEISLDHDLGGEDIDPDDPNAWLYRGASPNGSGLDLVDWMIREHLVPSKVTVHSMNGSGADRMVKTLWNHGYVAYRVPYTPPLTAVCDRCGETYCWRVGGRGLCGPAL